MKTNHDNAVLFIGADIENIEYVPDTFQITNGQPVNGVPTISQPDDNKWLVRISCGRSGSTVVATNFNNAVGTTNHEFTGVYMSSPPASTDKPSELNFYFALDFTFRGAGAPVRMYVGQGHTFTFLNNWWIGGSAVLNTYPGRSIDTFFYVSSSQIYLVTDVEDTSPAFSFVLHG